MSTTTSQDQSKKTSSVFEKLGQRITNIKKDIAENIERREQLHNNANNNQVQFLYRPRQSDDSLIIETKPPPPPTEVRQRLPSSDDGSSSERSFSISQFTSSFGKKSANENIPSTTTTEITPSNSFQDIFLSENSDHAKDMIKNNILHEVNRRHSQALSESGSDDFILNKTDHNDAIVKPTTVMKIDKHQRKPTMLLAGPKFRYHTSESNYDLKRDVIYPVLCVVGAISIYIMLWKPLSSFFSGYFLGFVSAMAVTYIIIKIYIHAKTDESIVHEWIDFPELESLLQEKIARTDKHTSQYTCCEVVFGRYDVDRDGEFLRYPAIIHLDKYRLNIQLPTKTMTADEKKDKEIKFVGFREYTIKGANLILVPEATLTRIKYWLNEYPIVLQNLQISNKQICVVGAISIYIMLWKPLSSFFSGYFLGFVSAMAVTYIIIKIYIHAKTDESIVHEWIDFPELESLLQEKIARTDKHTSQYTCCEVVFGRYDVDRDGEFLRYPAIIHLDKYRFNIQLPTKTMTADEKKDKEIKFVGFREYTIKGANLILVPEATLTRIKYWLNEYPIVLQNLQISNKQIVNKQFYEKSKFDANDFFNNSHTTISLFFETGPDKEDWFHKLSLVLREGKSDIEYNDSQKSNLSTSNTIAKSISDTQIPTLGSRASQMQSNTVNLENRVQMKSSETVGPPYADTVSSENSETEILRSQINEGDILSDMTQARTGAQELRADLLEKKDSDKDSTGTQRTATTKKKYRKEEESLHRLLNSPDCLDEAAITLNFLTRRLFCDIFEEPLFKDLIKEKIELKLKEIAVSVLEDLHVETIDMGNTFPVILKVEPMQWNTKGIWFNLFLFYKGNFNFTIKTRIVLQKLLNYNPIVDQPMYYQHQSGQIVHKDEERQETEELIQRQKLLAKEPEIPENAAARKLGILLTKVAANKHFQRFAALKPVAGVIEKLSNAEVGANIELMSFSGMMTINIPPPPSDRIWIGFSEMPDLNLKVTPVFGESKYSYTLIHDFLEARIRDEIKRLLVLPAMDDQLLPFFRDWVLDIIGEIASKSSNQDMNRTSSEEF
ncbi:unnamed protein product [Adineta steineri]|uniref:SMP-LTD domain-containing protein n=4 Tax=Adineta steineri TaxID=433720 RepID=A0A814HUP3_9BILA|nr:unnamed protein product [Adineta steineri]